MANAQPIVHDAFLRYQSIGVSADRRLRKAIQFVLYDLSNRPTVSDVARVASLERTYFSRYFRRKIGVTYSMWERSVRIERAGQLLETTEFSITTIAGMVGYADLTTFERNFRRCKRCSPRQFRSRVKITGPILSGVFSEAMHDAALVRQIRTRYRALAPVMDERMRRQWAATEAQTYGWGGLSAVSEATGMSRNTIRKGMVEIQAGQKKPKAAVSARLRKAGGGRKRLAELSISHKI